MWIISDESQLFSAKSLKVSNDSGLEIISITQKGQIWTESVIFCATQFFSTMCVFIKETITKKCIIYKYGQNKSRPKSNHKFDQITFFPFSHSFLEQWKETP